MNCVSLERFLSKLLLSFNSLKKKITSLKRAWQPTPVFLPGESPWTEEPGGLQSKGSQRVGHD